MKSKNYKSLDSKPASIFSPNSDGQWYVKKRDSLRQEASKEIKKLQNAKAEG